MKKLVMFTLLGLLFSRFHNVTLYPSKTLDQHEHETNAEYFKDIDKEKRKENNEVEDGPYLDTEAAHYYYNLRTNYPLNHKGTCAFVAIAMLLQYYDSFWNDNIISESFEIEMSSATSINDITESPGTRPNVVEGYDDEDVIDIPNADYFNIVMANHTIYFQYFLFKIAYYDLDMLSMYTEDCFASLTSYGREDLMNHYLQNYTPIDEEDYTFETLNNDYDMSQSENVKEYIIEKVILGIPVLVCMSWNTFLHACIAYDYDAATDRVFLHGGDYDCTYHFDAELADSAYFMSAATLNLHGVAHSHSDNYKLINDDESTTSYCGCQLDIHNHVYQYTSTGVSYHRITCFCGENYLARHSLTGTGHLRYCMYCNQLVDTTQGPIISMGNKEENETE